MIFAKIQGFGLRVALLICVSYLNSTAQSTLIFEDFNRLQGTRLPTGWSSELITGNSATDSFHFGSDQFIAFGLLEEGFASFDVYNGGFRGSSNGDGSIEDIALKLPLLVSDSGKSAIEFTYHLVRLRTPVFSIELKEQGKLNWVRVWADSTGTNAPVSRFVNLSNYLRKGVRFELRFRWQTKDIQLTQGYVLLDNVHVFNLPTRDLAIRHEPGKPFAVQRDDYLKPQIDLINYGQSTLKDVPFLFRMLRSDGSTAYQFSDTLKSLAPGSTQTVPYKSFQLKEEGKFLLSSILGAPDDNNSNDTFRTVIWVRDSLMKPETRDGARCGPGKVLLKSVQSPSGTLWEDGDSTLGYGAVFHTPDIGRSRTYFARGFDSTGFQLSSGQGPYRFNGFNTGAAYITVIASRTIRLENLAMHYANSAVSHIKVYVKKGEYTGFEKSPMRWTLLFEDSVQTGSWGQSTWLDIPDLAISSGDTLSFCIVSRGYAAFTFKRGTFTTEKEGLTCLSSAVSSDFSNSGIVYSGYSWDGKLDFSTLIVSPKVAVQAVIVKKPAALNMRPDPDFFGIPKLGSYSSPDQLAEDGKAVYRINSPKGWSNADYGKNWRSVNVSVRTSGGIAVPDSMFWFISPSAGKDMQLGVRSNSTFVDSTLRLEVTVEDLQSKCDTVLYRIIHVSRRPKAKFVHNGYCAGELISFENRTTYRDTLSYEWDFGHGAKASDYHAVYRFSGAGSYRVKLTARNKYGITGIFEDTLNILAYPTALASVIHACEGSPVRILPNRAVNPSGTSFELLGDAGLLRSNPTPDTVSHHFAKTGKHLIQLIANNQGCRDTAFIQAYQFPNPVAGFKVEENCQHDLFRFENISAIEGDEKLGFQWYRNNQLFSTLKSPALVESKTGLIDYRLIAVSQFNCRDTLSISRQVLPAPKSLFKASLACDNEPTVFFNRSDLPSGLQYVYNWDFGDGILSGDSSPSHAYTSVGEHRVSLRITGSNGCSSKYDSVLVVRVQPNARFTVGTVCSEEEAVFVNYSKTENKILKYKWYFGDGDSSEIHSPRHLYQTEETKSFRVRLRVYVEDGDCEDEYNEVVTVNRSPVCAFTAQRDSDPLSLRFEALDTHISEFTWSFEGGGFSQDPTPTHKFQVAGSYLVRLFARNEAACQCRGEQIVHVGSVSGLPFLQQNKPAIVIYPNPSQGLIRISGISGGKASVEMVNMMGQIVWSRQNVENLQSMDISGLAAGMYGIRVVFEGNRSIHSLLLE